MAQASLRSLQKLFSPTAGSATNTLFSKISPIGNPEISIVPELDHWVSSGREATHSHLRFIIRQLRLRRRFKHALEVSEWMDQKRYATFSCQDVATHMNLIFRVHGVDQVQSFFDGVPAAHRTHELYVALLNAYAHVKDVDKAEAVMSEIKSHGWARFPLSYNLLLTMYYRLRRWDRLEAVLREMRLGHVPFDKYTFGTRLSAHAATSDASGIARTLSEMEAGPAPVYPDSNTYAVAADCYLKVGMPEKGLEMLGKAVSLIHMTGNKDLVYATLLKLYGDAGDRDELYRIWNLYRRCRRPGGVVQNKVYRSMIRSLLGMDDVASAESVFGEWGAGCQTYDVRIPNTLLGVYCRRGYLGKAEALVREVAARGGSPNLDTWCPLADLYMAFDHIPEAVGALMEAVRVCSPGSEHHRETLSACLSCLGTKGDDGLEGARKVVGLLRAREVFSEFTVDGIFV